MATPSYVKLPPPRQLTQNETLDSLDHWKSIFRSFFRRDSIFRQFLESDCEWDPSREHYGLTDKNGMKAKDRKDALIDFLNNLAGFLPHSYLTPKLIQNTKSLEECWGIIEEHYNVQISSETLLDFESMRKEPAENYRQFYERLLQHCRLHLAPEKAKVDNLKNTKKDEMSISIMNFVALQWLRKIDPQLILIVKTEFSTDLRSGDQLASLVPRIAPNIDSLLSRYSSGSTVSKISGDEVLKHSEDETECHDHEHVMRIGTRGRGKGRNFRGGRGSFQTRSQQFCAGCYALGKELNTFIHFKHSPNDCTRQGAVARLLQTGDDYPAEDDADFYDDGKQKEFIETEEVLNDLQSKNYTDSPTENSRRAELPTNFIFTINVNQQPGELNRSSHIMANNNPAHTTNITESRISDMTELVRKIKKIEKRKHLWSSNNVRKESSPMVSALLNTVTCTPTIDEGSEINCIDAAFAAKCSLRQVSTSCSATAAGDNAMTVTGQTLDNVILHIPNVETPVKWNLFKCVVVKNLGVDVLVGEPGKIDNIIETKSHQQKLETRDVEGNVTEIPYFKKREETRFVCRAIRSETIFPGDSVSVKIPPHLLNETALAIAPTRESEFNFVTPKVVQIDDEKSIQICNDSQHPVRLKRNSPIADLTSLKIINAADTRKMPGCNKICTEAMDQTHLLRPKIFSGSEANKSYTHEVIIDPDNLMAKVWKERFKKTCERYSDVINPNPGRYNSYYGNVDCTIDFCSTPPPSVKARLPNYSTEKLKIMAELMDKMEGMGVLAKPEDVGVVPAFVVPSLLVPKPEKGEWRLVSDFAPLNTHIRKFETISPGIEEAKRTIAKYKYNIEMDLSNYFWQGGMRREDMQYLATPHPFKGLRVYTVEPQGLRNASEHSYEKLTRIYGDLRQADKMTCMADGLYVVGDTLQDLHETFMEVLDRARKCGLTFKPKKIVIAPKDTVLFGWRKIGNGWRPMDHTISPLVRAEEPNTVKQLRSFIGAYKQITECIADYAVFLAPLEKAVAGRESAEKVIWSSELSDSFKVAKEALENVESIHVPKPDDKLEIFVDYSQDKKAVGGKLIIKRTEVGKSINTLLGGYFSCKLNVHQKNWLPCEGEALGVKLICKHFTPVIRESKNVTTVFTDNLPTVHAWRRMKTGAFSASARVASFLTGLSALTVELMHKPGKEMLTSDYNSRHPNSCSFEKCKICKFSYEMERVGDAAVYTVRAINAKDVEDGHVRMPHSQIAAWKKVQSQDHVHRILLAMIRDSKIPERKKTKGDFTRVKRLHNLYRTGQAKIDSDGFLTVTHTDTAGNSYNAISVPANFYPGLVHALHIKLSHPSKTQMQRLMNRYFYCTGQARIVEEVTNACTVCASLKELPKELFTQSTTENPTFGANFSADVIKKDGQLIFLCREKLSQFTFTRIIPDETADSLRDSIVSAVLDFMPESGTTIQVDCAPGLQTLAAESNLDGSILKKLGIQIDLGRIHNVNKNPVAENAIKEFHKERLRLNPSGGKINEIDRSIITKNMNSRVRERGLTPKEMAFNRDQITNELKPSNDVILCQRQTEIRTNRHPSIKVDTETKFNVGDNVFLKTDKSKLRGREVYKVTDLFQKNEENWAIIQKCETKFMSKEYKVKISEIFKLPENKDIKKDEPPEDDTVVIRQHENRLQSVEDTLQRETPSSNKKSLVSEEKESDDSHEDDSSVPEDNGDITESVINSRPPKRKAALKFNKKLKELIPCLRIQHSIDIKPPAHGWKYDDWVKDIDDDDEDLSYEPYHEQAQPKPEVDDYQPLESPFGKVLNSLDDLSFQTPTDTVHEPITLES